MACHVDHSGDEDAVGDGACVAASFAALGADDVDAEIEGFACVFGVADHVHDVDAGLVEAFDYVLGWYAYGRDEEAGAFLGGG